MCIAACRVKYDTIGRPHNQFNSRRLASKLTHSAHVICPSKVAVLLCSKTEVKRLRETYESDMKRYTSDQWKGRPDPVDLPCSDTATYILQEAQGRREAARRSVSLKILLSLKIAQGHSKLHRWVSRKFFLVTMYLSWTVSEIFNF